VIESFLTCLTDADCMATGDSCGGIDNLACFPDNGVLGASISVAGAPDPLGADLTATPTLVGLTCVAGTDSAALNSVAGWPVQSFTNCEPFTQSRAPSSFNV